MCEIGIIHDKYRDHTATYSFLVLIYHGCTILPWPFYINISFFVHNYNCQSFVLHIPFNQNFYKFKDFFWLETLYKKQNVRKRKWRTTFKSNEKTTFHPKKRKLLYIIYIIVVSRPYSAVNGPCLIVVLGFYIIITIKLIIKWDFVNDKIFWKISQCAAQQNKHWYG